MSFYSVYRSATFDVTRNGPVVVIQPLWVPEMAENNVVLQGDEADQLESLLDSFGDNSRFAYDTLSAYFD